MLITTDLYGELVLLTTPMLVELSEVIGFATDVFEAQDGTEERTPLKDYARQTLSFSSFAIKDDFAQFFNVQWGGIRKLWGVPLWSEMQKVGDVDGNFITCNTTLYDFRDNSLAVLKNGDGFQVVEISTVEETGLQLSAAVTSTNAILMPVRVCFISGDITRNTNGWYSTASCDFVVIDESTVNPKTPDQYLDDDIYWFNLGYTGDTLEAKISQNQNTLDAGIGLISQTTDWDMPTYAKDYQAVLKGRQSVVNYKNFLFRRQGRYRQFWLPTFERNLNSKSTGNVTTTLLVEIDQYKQLADLRNHIAIKAGGAWTAHTITASSFLSASTVSLKITPSLDKDASTIQGISYLGLHRLDADSVTLKHQGANIVEVSVPILEIGV